MLIAKNEREMEGIIIFDTGIIRAADINGEVPLRCRLGDCLAGGRTKVILNLTNCPRLGGEEIGDLAAIIAVVRSPGGKLRLIVGRRVYDSLQLNNLLTVFDVNTDEEAAVRNLRDQW